MDDAARRYFQPVIPRKLVLHVSVLTSKCLNEMLRRPSIGPSQYEMPKEKIKTKSKVSSVPANVYNKLIGCRRGWDYMLYSTVPVVDLIWSPPMQHVPYGGEKHAVAHLVLVRTVPVP